MLLVLLTILATIAAALTISSEYHGPRRMVYIFKPLTIVLIISIVFLPKYPVSQFYKYMIAAGLVCSLIGDVFLMLPVDRFISGLVSFLVAHLLYVAAFIFEGNRSFSVLVAVPLLAYGVLMLSLLWRGFGKMRAQVVVYMLALMLMAWAAMSRYLITRQGGSLLAAVGAVLFVASDSILAVERFRKRFRIAQFLILLKYFIAQCLIALST